MQNMNTKILQMRHEGNTQGLLDLIEELPRNIIMAEIGCYAGESTEMFLKSTKVQQLYAIDPWRGCYNDAAAYETPDFSLVELAFDERVKNYNVIKLKMTMLEAFNMLPELDAVYIDGNHEYSYVLEDIKLSLQKVKKGGFICGHDYLLPDVMQAVKELLTEPNKVFSDQSWIVQI